MLRTALRPRWVAALVLALAVATVFSLLGRWQLDRSQRSDPDAAPPPVVDLVEVAEPQVALPQDALRPEVRVTGAYRAGDQLEVVQRELDGRPGRWVLAPLEVRDVVDGATVTATLPVVRGWVAEGQPLPAPPDGEVTVLGRMHGSMRPAGRTDLPPDQVRGVSAADLVNVWDPPLYAGYLVVTEDVDPGLAPVPVQSSQGRGFNLLNLSYALQWWVFAGFAVFLWWRVVADAHRREVEDAEPGPSADADPARGEPGPDVPPGSAEPDSTEHGPTEPGPTEPVTTTPQERPRA
ncbi:SURF1 family protein [Thalassiella azotivora]